MKALETRMAEWHNRRYGGKVNVPATYRKLLEEIGEVGEAIMKDYGTVIEEIGDVIACLMHLARGIDPALPFEQIIELAVVKLEDRERNGKK